jgi:ubiquinol-cytochrome c reductase iron-sulfur subunit
LLAGRPIGAGVRSISTLQTRAVTASSASTVSVVASSSSADAPIRALHTEWTKKIHTPGKYATVEEIKKNPYTSIDKHFESWQRNNDKAIDPSGRFFVYTALGANRMMYLTGVRLLVMKIIHSLAASADVMASAKLEVDLTKIYEGTTVAVKWRGKPVFVRNRTQREIDAARADDDVLMKDPAPDEMRVKKAQWLIVLGICTHLGCVPLANAGNWKGWFCPCHGSHYDTSGRIRLGPAPLNLEVPEYAFLDADHLVIG